MSAESHAYGNKPTYAYESLRPGVDDTAQGQIERVTIDEDCYWQALEDITKTLAVHEDRQMGRHFEIAVANLKGSEETVDAEMSTFSSSITTNEGNAVELAEHSALYPTRRRVYIASFGNGGSSYWDAKEQKYIKQTGRFVQSDGSPLPTIAALGRVLGQADLDVSRFSTDSAGGAYATALMAALPEDQVTHAYLKSRPNITNHPFALAWGAHMQVANNRDKRRELAVSHDPWRKTEASRAAAHLILQRVYGEKDGLWTMHGVLVDNGLNKVRTDAKALSRGGSKYGQPAAKDTLAALARQPDAKFTFHFPEGDRSYSRDVEGDVRSFLAAFDEGQVEALITLGGHLLHIAYPTMRMSFENYAFTK
jgi:hypothetical protein